MSETGQAAGSQTPAAAEQLPGLLLAQTRRQRGQTVAEVAQQLKLSPRQVEALEADEYARLPGPVFVRGFVRNYARLLGIDPGPLLVMLEPLRETAAAAQELPHSEDIPFEGGGKRRWPWLAAALGLLVAAVLVFEWLFPQSLLAPSPGLPAAAPRPLVLPAVPSAVLETPLSGAAPAAASPPSAADPPAVQGAAPAVTAAAVNPPPAGGDAELRLVFERRSWVEVRDRDDRVLFSQNNAAGAVQVLQVTPPLSLVIGNAGGVRLTYRGKPVDLAPYAKTDVARLTLE